MRRSFVFATLAIAAAAAASCSKFGAEGSGPSDGGADGAVDDAGPQIARDLSVVIDWPTGELDPYSDARARDLFVTVVDATDASKTQTQKLDKTRGPVAFPGFVSSRLVDVTVEVRGADDRLLSFGVRRAWDVGAQLAIPVAVRQRLLYFASFDRGAGPGGELRVLGLTPADPEPAMKESLPELASLRLPTGLYLSRDALLLVETGTHSAGDAGIGTVRIFATATHQTLRDVPLPFSPAALAPLGDGHRAVVAPAGSSQFAGVAVADLDTNAVDILPIGSGGWIDAPDAAASPAGDLVAIAGGHASSAKTDATLWLVDAAKSLSTIDLSNDLDTATGVRFTPDGKTIVVAGKLAGNGKLVTIDAFARTIAGRLPIGVRPASILMHPDGKHLFVDTEDDGTAILDLGTGSSVFKSPYSPDGGLEFEVVSGVSMPYPPFRIIGGQSDTGNNWQNPLSDFVDMSDGGAAPVFVPLQKNGDIGTAGWVSTPFGQPL